MRGRDLIGVRLRLGNRAAGVHVESHMHRPTCLLVAATAAALVLAACGGDDAPSDTTATTPSTPVTTDPTTTAPAPGGDAVPADLLGVTWVFDGYFTVGGLQPLPVADSGAGLTFQDDGTVLVDTGCNQGSGTVTFTGDTLQVGPIAVTEKACLDDDVMQIEQMLLGQLQEEQSWSTDGSQLNLYAARISDTGMSFHDASNPPADDTTTTTVAGPGGDAVPEELAGVRWTLVGTDVAGDVQSVPNPNDAGFTITTDGRIEVDTGCNRGSGTATFAGDLLVVGPVATTRMACVDEVAADTERLLLDHLGLGEQRWSVADGELRMTATAQTDTVLLLQVDGGGEATDPSSAPTTS